MNKLLMHCDVAVIGAGAAGIAAAVAAAESGLKVVLVERYGFVGGMATAAMVGTICGLYYRSMQAPRFALHGFARQFAQQVGEKSATQAQMFDQGLHFLPYQPHVFQQQAMQALQQAGVQLLLHSYLSLVKTQAERISELHIQTANHHVQLQARCVIDCSGNAQVSTLAELPLDQDEIYQAGAFVFQVCGLPAMDAAMLSLNLIGWIKRAIHAGELEPCCERISIVPGTLQQGCALFKLGMDEPYGAEVMSLTQYETLARARSIAIVEYLQQSQPLLKALQITSMSAQVGIRSGPRAQGLQCLHESAILSAAKPDDGVVIGTWPIEYWGAERKPDMQYFAMHDYYLIPAGALVSKHVNNLFFAGRILSASALGIASARVIGTCLGSGFAAGKLAAASVQTAAWQTAIDSVRKQQGITGET